MGQYHSVINLSRRTGYSPRSLGSLLKLMEQAHSTTATAALTMLLAGTWAGDRVAVIGDYAEDSDLPDSTTPFLASTLVDRIEASDGVRNVGWLGRKVVTDVGIAEFTPVARPWGPRYEAVIHDPATPEDAPEVVAVNLDSGQRLTPRLLGETGRLLDAARWGTVGGTGTALYILLAASCAGGARGGGDIASESPLVGSWAGARVSIVPKVAAPEGEDITGALRDVMSEAREAAYEVADAGSVTRLTWDEMQARGIW